MISATISLPNPDPVPNVLTGHQRLQVVSAHVVRRSLIYPLWHSLQEAHWYISERDGGGVRMKLGIVFICSRSLSAGQTLVYLHRKDSHSNMKLRVFSTPRVSEPQCSRPKLVKSLRMSSRSLDDMSQCLPSFISVKIQGLIRAPLQKSKSIICILQFGQICWFFHIFMCNDQTHLAIIIPETPVSFAFTASS